MSQNPASEKPTLKTYNLLLKSINNVRVDHASRVYGKCVEKWEKSKD